MSAAASNWSDRQHAQNVANDATTLQVYALARAELNDARVPAQAVSFSAHLGIDENELSALLHVNFKTMLQTSFEVVTQDKTFRSNPTLSSDLTAYKAIIPKIEGGKVSYAQVSVYFAKFASDIDDAWYSEFNQLQLDVNAWRPPGSFEVNVAALRQTYSAFLAGGDEIEGSIYVLEGQGGAAARQEIIQSSALFASATSQFEGHLGAKAHQAWNALLANPANKSFQQTITLAVNVALNGGPPPFLTNLSGAGTAMRKGLHYLGDVNTLVRAASADLHDTAVTEASQAAGHFVRELAFLFALAAVSVGGVVFIGRVLSRPLKRLAGAALQVHKGEFDLEHLPDGGPKEVATTTAAFNDMALTLKAVELKTMGLASEDLELPELLTPLPGRTGQALQAAVDRLTARIHEREEQRRQLHEAATHDWLTGLFNRPAVIDFLTNDVSRRREAGETVAVLFVDLDELKPINDLYGHEAGDFAIRATAHALLQATGSCDVVGRLGGDEFLVVLCSEDSGDGEAVADRIHQMVASQSISVAGLTVPLRCSVGVALAQCDADTDPMELMQRADQAMYQAKRAARATRDRMAAATTKQEAVVR